MLANFFVADDLQYQIEQHHRLHKGFVIDFGMRSAGTVYDKLLHWVSHGLEVLGWRVEIHRSPVYAEWERSEFVFLHYFIIFVNLFFVFRTAKIGDESTDPRSPPPQVYGHIRGEDQSRG